MAKVGRPKNKYMAKIESPCKGVATYYTEHHQWVFHAHWSADPLKDDKWAAMVAASTPGGQFGVDFLQEFEADDEAKAGERVYWAFDRARNVIKPWVGGANPGTMGVPRDWPIYLGADFGQRNKTAIIFLAQDPATKRLYCWNSIVVPKGIDVSLKEAVYRTLSDHLDIDIQEMKLAGAYKYYERAVPDPSADSYTAFFAMEPWPIFFTKKPSGKVVTRHRPGESRLNAAMWPAVTHCQTLSYIDRTDGEADETRTCTVCGQGPFEAKPSLYFFEGACPELVEQLDELVDKEPTAEGLEVQEKYVDIPRDAADALRYVVFDLWDPDRGVDTEDETDRKIRILREKPVKSATDKLQLVLASALEEQSRLADRRLKTGRPQLARAGEFRHGSIRFKPPAPDVPAGKKTETRKYVPMYEEPEVKA